MREIKFRAWDTQLKTFTYSGFGSKTFGIFIKRVNCQRYKIQQYTGLKDKNGVEIYEGDILKEATGSCVSWKDGRAIRAPIYDIGYIGWGGPFTGYVRYHSLDSWNYWVNKISSPNTEIIGNIDENPKLLEEK